MFPDSFDNIDHMPDEYNITLNPNFQPMQQGQCRVSVDAKEEIKIQIREMTVQDIITPQVVPTPWLSLLTYLHNANGSLTVCMDPKGLNKCIIHKHHKAPTLKELHIGYTQVSRHNYIFQIRCQKLFCSIHLTHESTLLTTFNTQLGRYWFEDIYFCLNMSQIFFQMKMDQTVERFPTILCIHNDMHLWQIRKRTQYQLTQCITGRQQQVLYLKAENVKENTPPKSFYGIIFSKENRKPDPEKIQGITEMPPQMYNCIHFQAC